MDQTTGVDLKIKLACLHPSSVRTDCTMTTSTPADTHSGTLYLASASTLIGKWIHSCFPKPSISFDRNHQAFCCLAEGRWLQNGLNSFIWDNLQPTWKLPGVNYPWLMGHISMIKIKWFLHHFLNIKAHHLKHNASIRIHEDENSNTHLSRCWEDHNAKMRFSMKHLDPECRA